MTTTEAFQRAWQAHQTGDLRRAEEGYLTILQEDHRNGRVWFVLSMVVWDQGRLGEAVACSRRALDFGPDDPQGYLALGNTLLQLRRNAQAEDAFRRSLELEPRQVQALVNLGVVLGEQGRFAEARAFYEQARALAPAVPEIHHNLGNVLSDLGELEAATAAYDEAIRLRPDYAKAHVNRGVALMARGRVDEAETSFRRGIELQPDGAEAHSGLGTVLTNQGRLDQAEAAFERAVRLDPEYPDAQSNLAVVRLLCGDYERGWPAYEWRWRCKKAFRLPPYTQPRWDGTSLEGRTILLHAEQGFGDTLQFVRYAPLVKARGGRVVLQCQEALIPLLARSPGIDVLVAWGAAPPPFDVWSPLMNLPGVLRTTLDTIPAPVPYLAPDPARVEHWRYQLAPVAGVTVGITWQGSRGYAADQFRSVPLAAFEPLARVPGVRLVSLQKGYGEDQLRADVGFPVVSFGGLLDQSGGAFMDTAAILSSLDLTVSVDSALGHLAGGLGLPVWVALPHTPDWRWLRDRADSPWYPTARLFRQPTPGDWAAVFARIAEELGRLVASRPRRVVVEVSAGELIDKLAILRIKAERMTDPAKLRNVRAELAALTAARAGLGSAPGVAALEAELLAVNEQLWAVEDALREREGDQDFGPEFVALARSVYRTNDHRSALKRALNDLLASRLVEEKDHPSYPTA